MESMCKNQISIRNIVQSLAIVCKEQIAGQIKMQGLVADVICIVDESLGSDEAVSIARQLSEGKNEGFQPKTVIFCLTVRKISQQAKHRHTKFAFFLIRCLMIEQKTLDSKASTITRSSIECKKEENKQNTTLGVYQRFLITKSLRTRQVIMKKWIKFIRAKEKIILEKAVKVTAILKVFNKHMLKLFYKFLIYSREIHLKRYVSKNCIQKFCRILGREGLRMAFRGLGNGGIRLESVNYSCLFRSYREMIGNSVGDRKSMLKKGMFKLKYITKHLKWVKKMAFARMKRLGKIKCKAVAVICKLIGRNALEIYKFGFESIKKAYLVYLRCDVLWKTLLKTESTINTVHKSFPFQAMKDILNSEKNLKVLNSLKKILESKIHLKQHNAFLTIIFFKQKMDYQLKNLKKFEEHLTKFSKKYLNLQAFLLLKRLNSQVKFTENTNFLMELLKNAFSRNSYKSKFFFFHQLKKFQKKPQKPKFSKLKLIQRAKILKLFQISSRKMLILSFHIWEDQAKQELLNSIRFSLGLKKRASSARSFTTRSNTPILSRNSTRRVIKKSNISKLLPRPASIHDYIDDMLEITSRKAKGIYFKYKLGN